MKAIIYDKALDSGEADGTSYYFTWRAPRRDRSAFC